MQETFPDQLGDVDLDGFVRAINRAEPGLIRVDADETTYSLHIILRFELEQELIAGTVALEDLPEIWNARIEGVPRRRRALEYGRRAPGRALVGRRDRLLPDLCARQRDLAADLGQVQKALPDLDEQMAAGDLLELSNWLRDNLYAWGAS